MHYKISLRPLAIENIDAIYESRENYRVGYGANFLEDLANLILQLQAFPFSAPRVGEFLRRGVTNKTKYNLYYKVVDQTVEILYIIHGTQDY